MRVDQYIKKLETVSKHPDLGPLGEGLITLMDQKLSQLDQRLYELTAKIQSSQNEKVEQIHFDIGASAQKVLEYILLKIVDI